MKRRTYLTSLGSLATVGVAGCVGDEEPEDTDDEELSDGEVVAEVDPENITDHQLFDQYQNPRATHVEGDGYAVAVEAMQYIYAPGSNSPIEVPENSKVSFYMASRDITHAFTIENKNINAEIPPEVIVEVTVEFEEYEELTEYEITCGEEFCVDHDPEAREAMTGKIQVSSSWDE